MTANRREPDRFATESILRWEKSVVLKKSHQEAENTNKLAVILQKSSQGYMKPSLSPKPLNKSEFFQISKAPRDLHATRMVAFDESPVYEGVAHKLGYKPKNGGFQWREQYME